MKNSFIINGRLPSLNDYILECRKHAVKGGKFKREWQERVEYDILIAKQQKRLRAVNKPVIVHFYYEESKQNRDCDNVSSFCRKISLDALVEMQILKNDSPKYVKGFVEKFYHSDIDRITIILEEVDE